MKKTASVLQSLLAALFSGALVLLAATLAATTLRNSDIYSKSRLIRMIITQDQVKIADMAGNRRNVDMMLKFVGALTSAYIDFEMIPVNEVSTFAAVFESTSPGITIERFAYHRKNLTITGDADTPEDYENFVAALEETAYFESVRGHPDRTAQDAVRFEIVCAAASASVSLDFSGRSSPQL